MTYVLAASRMGYADLTERLAETTGEDFHLIEDRSEFTLERLTALNPRLVFLPHWSYLVPREIFEKFECVIFHMTDLPFGRGGSPLQNLITRGICETKLTALRCVAEVDAGPIYLQKPMGLAGTAEEIYGRGALLVEQMIQEIIITQPKPHSQTGEIVTFKRRTPEQSNLAGMTDPQHIYDHIRMLDAEGYPHAFLEVEGLRLEFTGAELNDGSVKSQVRVIPSDTKGGA